MRLYLFVQVLPACPVFLWYTRGLIYCGWHSITVLLIAITAFQGLVRCPVLLVGQCYFRQVTRDSRGTTYK